jgi:hypothetical protein
MAKVHVIAYARHNTVIQCEVYVDKKEAIKRHNFLCMKLDNGKEDCQIFTDVIIDEDRI